MSLYRIPQELLDESIHDVIKSNSRAKELFFTDHAGHTINHGNIGSGKYLKYQRMIDHSNDDNEKDRLRNSLKKSIHNRLLK